MAEAARRDTVRRWRPRAALLGGLVGGCLWGLLVLAGGTPQGRSLEALALDGAYLLRATGARPADILVVAVDEPSFQEIGLPWPWPRRLHAKLLERLGRAGARAVILDMVFAEPSTPADDAALAAALAGGAPAVLAAALETVDDPAFSRLVRIDPLPLFAGAAAGVGLAVLTPDPDGVVRRFATHQSGLPTLAGTAAGLLSPDGRVPEAAGLIDYPGPPRTLDTVSYAAVIDPDHPLPASRIAGRLVVVGRAMAASAAPLGQADTFPTPFTRQTGQPAFGPEIHAAILATLAHGGPGREPPLGTALAWLGLLLPACGALVFCLRPVAAAATAVGLAGGLCGLAAGLFVWRFFWLPPALVSVGLLAAGAAATLYRGLVESREKRFLARAFSRYLSPVVVRDLVRRPERLELGGEEAEVTVLFSDLAGFTSFSETLAPRELIAVLNAWFTPATDSILAAGGTLDKFIGDAVMAFWGAPLAEPRHAAKALEAALTMAGVMDTVSAGLSARGLPRLAARFGLHAGLAVVGNVGSRERFNYTILGDTVNLASRLESLNKQYGTTILASRAVMDAAGNAFPAREIDLVRVKGRAAAVAVFEPLGPPGAPLPAYAAPYAAALADYRERRFEAALAGFTAADAARGGDGDGPARVLAARCRRYLAAPPPADWDGVFVPGEK